VVIDADFGVLFIIESPVDINLKRHGSQLTELE
jgi:hypothetical protein